MKHLKITTLDKGWQNKDEMMLHAAFQLLVDFVEQEEPERWTDWDQNRSLKQAWREINRLYTWWKKIRPNRKMPLHDPKIKKTPDRFKKTSDSDLYQMLMPDKKKHAEYYRVSLQRRHLKEKWHREDQRNLHRLIDVRRHLWT